MGAACAPGPPDRRGRARSMTKTPCISSRGKCALGGHTQCSPETSQSTTRIPLRRELQESLGGGCFRGAAKLESGSPAVLCEGAPRKGTIARVPSPPANPGQDSNSFQSPSHRPEPDRFFHSKFSLADHFSSSFQSPSTFQGLLFSEDGPSCCWAPHFCFTALNLTVVETDFLI